jgi:putative flippase GtrA
LAALLERIETLRASGMIGQLIRFGIAGVISTAIYAGVYWPLATYLLAPMLAGAIGFAVAVVAGFFLHSGWSFKGHGARDTSGRQHAKFLAVQAFGFCLNELYIWALVGRLHGPTWWPLVPTVFVTPLLTFALNRQWVFGAEKAG